VASDATIHALLYHTTETITSETTVSETVISDAKTQNLIKMVVILQPFVKHY